MLVVAAAAAGWSLALALSKWRREFNLFNYLWRATTRYNKNSWIQLPAATTTNVTFTTAPRMLTGSNICRVGILIFNYQRLNIFSLASCAVDVVYSPPWCIQQHQQQKLFPVRREAHRDKFSHGKRSRKSITSETIFGNCFMPWKEQTSLHKFTFNGFGGAFMLLLLLLLLWGNKQASNIAYVYSCVFYQIISIVVSFTALLLVVLAAKASKSTSKAFLLSPTFYEENFN